MKNIIRRVALAVIASSCVCIAPIMAQDVTAYDLEKALMKYVLTYEAYQKAKDSTNKEIRANLPKYIRLYREAYAQYLELLRQAELYDPTDDQKDNDPAGNFNKKQKSYGRSKQVWKPVKSGSQREQVRKVIENGGTPDDVFIAVKNNLPKESYSKTEEQEKQEQENQNSGNNNNGNSVTAPESTNNGLEYESADSDSSSSSDTSSIDQKLLNNENKQNENMGEKKL